MARAQTGIASLPQKYNLVVSFKIQDIPMSAMSIGHIAANVPGLANEIQKSYPGSDLRYTLGFGWPLWNFIWQGSMPPGFTHLETEQENEIEENEDDDDSGPELLFCFSASQPEILHELARQSQTHLKNIAEVHEMVLATPVENQANSHLQTETSAAGALIGKQHPEYAQSSFLFALSMTLTDENGDNFPEGKNEILNKAMLEDLVELIKNEPGTILHLNTWKTESACGHYLLAFCDHTSPFQNILDQITAASADSLKAPWKNIRISPSLYFLPSLEILAGLRMGTLRMGPLSPTARWK